MRYGTCTTVDDSPMRSVKRWVTAVDTEARRSEPTAGRHPQPEGLTIQLGILLAACCAVVTNLAFFFKQRGAAPRRACARAIRCAAGARCSAPAGSPRHARRRVAWLLHVAAMALAPLSDVQVVLAGGVVLVGVMADRVFGFPVARRQWLGLALTAAGLVAFALTVPGVRGAHASFSPAAMIVFEAALCASGRC